MLKNFELGKLSFVLKRTLSLGNSKRIMKPIVKFGVLADVQYADCENRPANEIAPIRHYRDALNQVDKAFRHWEQSDVQFILQLGDIIDGVNKKIGISESSLSRTLSHFESHPNVPTFHTLGNHDLVNFDKKDLCQYFCESMEKLKPPSKISIPMKRPSNGVLPKAHYSFCPSPHVKFICLDCYDISVLGYPEDHPSYQEAFELLKEKHGHPVFRDEHCKCVFEGLETRFYAQNGAISPSQLKWLDEELTESDEKRQNVLVFGHVDVHPHVASRQCLLWNYDEVMAVFQRHSCVVAYLNGHDHESAFAKDTQGISYITFASIVDITPQDACFATVSLYSDCVEVQGHGLEVSHSIPIYHQGANLPVHSQGLLQK